MKRVTLQAKKVPWAIHRMRLRKLRLFRVACGAREFPTDRLSSTGINRCGKRAARWASGYTTAELRLMGDGVTLQAWAEGR